MVRKVEVVPHNPKWQDIFEMELKLIADAFYLSQTKMAPNCKKLRPNGSGQVFSTSLGDRQLLVSLNHLLRDRIPAIML